jgi:hypothetical protein
MLIKHYTAEYQLSYLKYRVIEKFLRSGTMFAKKVYILCIGTTVEKISITLYYYS